MRLIIEREKDKDRYKDTQKVEKWKNWKNL